MKTVFIMKRFGIWKMRVSYQLILLLFMVCDVMSLQIDEFSHLGQVNSVANSDNRFVRESNNHVAKRQAAGSLRIGCKYYKIYRGKLSWDEAVNTCANTGEGGTLARIRGGYMNRFLSDQISIHYVDRAWFGIHKTDGNWTYTDQSCIGFQNWQEGALISDTDTNCAVLQSDGYWDTLHCFETKAFICELEEIPVDPCSNILCENGGTCQDGTCQCDYDYTGINCETCTPETVVKDGNFTSAPIFATSVKEYPDSINTFSINGDLFMVTCSHGNTCHFYKFDATGLTPLDTSSLFDGYLLTNGHHVESFNIGGLLFLAVAINRDPDSGSAQTLSFVFTWSESQSKFVLLQSLPSLGASHFHFFRTTQGDFLVLTNTQADNSFVVDSVVYRWEENSNLFVNFQTISTNRANEAISFTDEQTTYLIFAENKDNINLYRLAEDGSTFLTHEISSPFSRVRGFSKFFFQCEWHIVVFNTDGSVYVWRNGAFNLTTSEDEAFLWTTDGRTCTFEYDGYPYVVSAGAVSSSYHRPQITESTVTHVKFLNTEDRTCHVFKDNDIIYLAMSRLYESSIGVYQWRGRLRR